MPQPTELDIIITVKLIKKALSGMRFSMTDEKVLQQQIEDRFVGLVKYRREVHLSKENIIDFICDGVGIEIKLKGSAKAIYRQLERYCQFDEIKAIVLVTNKIMKLPAQINNKNTHIINLGKAWL